MEKGGVHVNSIEGKNKHQDLLTIHSVEKHDSSNSVDKDVIFPVNVTGMWETWI